MTKCDSWRLRLQIQIEIHSRPIFIHITSSLLLGDVDDAVVNILAQILRRLAVDSATHRESCPQHLLDSPLEILGH